MLIGRNKGCVLLESPGTPWAVAGITHRWFRGAGPGVLGRLPPCRTVASFRGRIDDAVVSHDGTTLFCHVAEVKSDVWLVENFDSSRRGGEHYAPGSLVRPSCSEMSNRASSGHHASGLKPRTGVAEQAKVRNVSATGSHRPDDEVDRGIGG